jgi:hypothetical protein
MAHLGPREMQPPQRGPRSPNRNPATRGHAQRRRPPRPSPPRGTHTRQRVKALRLPPRSRAVLRPALAARGVPLPAGPLPRLRVLQLRLRLRALRLGLPLLALQLQVDHLAADTNEDYDW